MDHSYGVMSQVSGMTTCKIPYIWAHQLLAKINVYGKKHTAPAWAWQTFGTLWEQQQLCPGSRTHEKPGQEITMYCKERGAAGSF